MSVKTEPRSKGGVRIMFRLKTGRFGVLFAVAVPLLLSIPALAQRSQQPGIGDSEERRNELNREQKKEGLQNRVRIVIENVAVSAWDDGKNVGAEMQLTDIGTGDARDVRIMRVEVSGGRYIGPQFLPVSLGDLASGNLTPLDAVFEVPADGSARLLRVTGEYVHGKERDRFSTETAIAPDGREPGPFTSMPGEAGCAGP